MSVSSSIPSESGSSSSNVILKTQPLSFPLPALDPWLFCVYHKDDYPAGNEKMEAPRKGNGADFNPSAPYRMYHGDRIPGFPQHPHRGFETVTATLTGIIDHGDSVGNAARYGNGDLQWLTAGKGIVHAEMFPLLNTDAHNPLKFFQIWLNLPAKDKMVDPHFKMHWGQQIPRFRTKDGLGIVTLWAGEVSEPFAVKALPPPKNSYGSDPASELGLMHLHLRPGASYNLPVAKNPKCNRALYITEGSQLVINGKIISEKSMITVDATKPTTVSVPEDAPEDTEVLFLQGTPIGEPVAKYGPFVMNTEQEIQQAFIDYRRTKFGGWPWPRDDTVWPKESPRFAQQDDVREMGPPPLDELAVTLGKGAKVEAAPAEAEQEQEQEHEEAGKGQAASKTDGAATKEL